MNEEIKNPHIIIFFLPYISPSLPKIEDEKKSMLLYNTRISEIKKRLFVYCFAISGINTDAVTQAEE